MATRRPPLFQKVRADRAIERILLESVAEKTGFPIDMLELDMQLDVDLGIDSIKRVEIFSAVQERLPDARAMGPEQVGTLRTLRLIAEFLSGSPAPQLVPPHEQTHSKSAKPAVAAIVPNEPRQNGSPVRNGATLPADSRHATSRCGGGEPDCASYALSAGASARASGSSRGSGAAQRWNGVDHQ